jgi:hypothetical protein
MLLQRFREGLPATLELQSLGISAGFDEVVSSVFQISEIQLKKTTLEWVREVSESVQAQCDPAAPLGSRENPAGPDQENPKDVRVWKRSIKCYNCRRYGHTRVGAGPCKWPEVPGNCTEGGVSAAHPH